ncbi:MAG: YggS family pyridoxal phosphate-dependent enzyme [Marinicaulis sp.]|nr:YggS family pyridoxal phosphate-dependent enzyme [Marinicaulis sp.]
MESCALKEPASDIDPAANLAAIRDELNKALKEALRPIDTVTINAVSKGHDGARIRPALEAGHRIYGENRVQEAMAKWPGLREEFADVELRLIGPLQTNKAKEAVAFFDVIETVDRPKIAKALAKEMDAQDRRPPVLIQINTGEEPQKGGVIPREAPAFIKACTGDYHLPVAGLMCIPPIDDAVAPHFALLRKMADAHDLKVCSMGMSGDYIPAAKLGATIVRIGSGVFGPRPAK